MSTGQIFLSLASLILLGYIAFNIHKMYLSSIDTTLDAQMTSDAVNFGRDLSEEIQSYIYKYSQLNAAFGNLDNPNNPSRRRTDTSQVGIIYHATVDLSNEKVLTHGQTGRIATITVYEETAQDSLEMKAKYVTSVINLGS